MLCDGALIRLSIEALVLFVGWPTCTRMHSHKPRVRVRSARSITQRPKKAAEYTYGMRVAYIIRRV